MKTRGAVFWRGKTSENARTHMVNLVMVYKLGEMVINFGVFSNKIKNMAKVLKK